MDACYTRHGGGHGMDKYRLHRHGQPDNDAARRGQHGILRQAVLHLGMAAAAAFHRQYGHTRGPEHGHIVRVQRVQHVLGRTLLGRARHRMAHVLRRFGDDCHLRSDRTPARRTRQTRHGIGHPFADGAGTEDGPSRRRRLRDRRTAVGAAAGRHD